MADETNQVTQVKSEEEPSSPSTKSSEPKPNPFADPEPLKGEVAETDKPIAPSYVQRIQAVSPEKKCFVKIVAIGDSGVGKTSLIQMFEHSRFTENFKPTIGADFSNKEITIDNKVVTLQIWDTAG